MVHALRLRHKICRTHQSSHGLGSGIDVSYLQHIVRDDNSLDVIDIVVVDRNACMRFFSQ